MLLSLSLSLQYALGKCAWQVISICLIRWLSPCKYSAPVMIFIGWALCCGGERVKATLRVGLELLCVLNVRNISEGGCRWCLLKGPAMIRTLLTSSMLRLLSSKAQRSKDFWKPSNPCHVGINWIALTEYSQMSTHLLGFQSFFASFCIGHKGQQQHWG